MIKKLILISSIFYANYLTAQEVNLADRFVTIKARDFKIIDTPGSVNVLTTEDLNKSLLKVNISEVLDEIPGVFALDRGNFSKDLALSVRGFGARSAQSGIRGQQIFIDGIPSTLPDGQSQSQNIALSTAGRIDLIKGPIATLYGNASGGIIQIYTKDFPENRYFQTEQLYGSWNQYRGNYQLAEKFEKTGYLLDYSTYKSDGFRINSQVERENFNAIFGHQLTENLKLKLIINTLDEPYAYDPRALSLYDALNSPYASSSPLIDRLRKVTKQNQYGQTLDYKISPTSHLTISTYFGDRSVQQFSTPSTQNTPARYIDSQRDFHGVNFSLNTKTSLYKTPIDLNFSVATSNSTELFTSGPAQAGNPVVGVVTRQDERRGSSISAVSHGVMHLTDNFSLLAGLRKTIVKIGSDDQLRMINLGEVTYDNLGYVLGALYHVDYKTSLYFNHAIGFETPTLTETLFTRVGNVNQGIFNTSLREAKNLQYEVGLKSFAENKSFIDAAIFYIKSKDELAVDINPGGSNISYKNIPGGTKRTGVELSYVAYPTKFIKTKLTGTMMQAEFDTSYYSGDVFVSSGNRIPGVPQKSLTLGSQYSSAGYVYAKNGFLDGWLLGYDIMYMGDMYTSDANDMKAPSYVTHRLHLSHGWDVNGVNVSIVGRINNIFDKRYVSSVQVSNPIPFEPGAPRNWLLGLRAQVKF